MQIAHTQHSLQLTELKLPLEGARMLGNDRKTTFVKSNFGTGLVSM